MATFPAIHPDEREYLLGQVPAVAYEGPGGVPVLFRVGTLQIGATVTLPFINRSQSEIESIWDHFYAQQLDPFDLPAAVWCGHAAAATIAGAGLLWRYEGEPEPGRDGPDVFDLTVTLKATGVAIGATLTYGLPSSGVFGGISGSGVSTAPLDPVPVPDPPVVPPTTVITPPVETILPPARIAIGSAVELRTGTDGLMATGNVEIGSAVELRTGTTGLMATGNIEIGSAVTLSFDL